MKNNNVNSSLELNNINRYYSKSRINIKLKPWQVTGLVDSEGGFFISISKNVKSFTGFSIKLEFKVTQKSHSEDILNDIKEYFGCGNVVIDNRKTDTKKYQISALSEILNIIIPHFDNYPCLTSKNLNFKDWKKISLNMYEKKHLTKKGLEEIIYISSNMNKKRSFEEKYKFCFKSLINSKENKFLELSPYWVQTFLNGEGMFYNYISEKKVEEKFIKVVIHQLK